ncbi:MAG: NADH-quinone oxidoreductase subunit L, partial [Chromatiales bacterium]|nr:NADH-quinone oxidoreductase subunit L [Chromatiales bacterium]
KDAIIEAVHHSSNPAAGLTYILLLGGVFVTALYSFRMFFLVFHGEERMDEHTRKHLHETPKVVTVPLILLAIPSVVLGYLTIGPVLFGDYFGGAITVAENHDVLAVIGEHFHGPWSFIVHGLMGPAFWLAMAGLFTAWFVYMKRPDIADTAQQKLSWLHKVLDRKYGFDEFNQWLFAGGSRGIGRLFWKYGDQGLIDGLAVNGTANSVGWFAGVLRHIQTGFLFHYAFAMILGLLVLMSWFLFW